ncbi:MAG TPA: hypothetical protein VJB57_19225 [Dehalococcoidia bacterium]|nr:hypothetical protein [Dehalococcoidia bacterium]
MNDNRTPATAQEARDIPHLADLMEDGLSEYDLMNFGSLVAGNGTWFHADLVRLCQHADTENLARISRGFPGTALAYITWMRIDGMRAILEALAAESRSEGVRNQAVALLDGREP